MNSIDNSIDYGEKASIINSYLIDSCCCVIVGAVIGRLFAEAWQRGRLQQLYCGDIEPDAVWRTCRTVAAAAATAVQVIKRLAGVVGILLQQGAVIVVVFVEVWQPTGNSTCIQLRYLCKTGMEAECRMNAVPAGCCCPCLMNGVTSDVGLQRSKTKYTHFQSMCKKA